MSVHKDSAGHPITVGDTVTWRGQLYTIKAFGDAIGRSGTRAIEFEEPLHLTTEIPDEIAVDLVQVTPHVSPSPRNLCDSHSPPWFVGHWRDWHRSHGCDRDDGRPRSEAATREIEQHAANVAREETADFLTDAELSFLRGRTTSGDTLLVRAIAELTTRRRLV